MKLFVCGSRTITNKGWIFEKLDECVKDNGFSEITVLESEAKGVDLIAKEWAICRNIPVKEYPIDRKTYGFKAPFVRNEQMAKDCDYMVAFWNGISTGTQHDIEMAEKYGKPYKVLMEEKNI
ncbi:MAG: DUF2493 domain-containing protein [Treponema sp.]|nr:DUF2493 domain-containing protein [Candidatus Treponema merdequi]